MERNPPSSHSHSECDMPLAESLPMNLPSSPPNHLEYCPPLSQPCLQWSRDMTWGPNAEDGCLPFGEISDFGSAVLGLSFGNNAIYDGQGLGYTNGRLTEFEDWGHDFAQDVTGEQWNAEARLQNTPLQSVHPTSQGIDNPDTTKKSILHHRVESCGENACHECSLQFPHISALNTHAKLTQHAPYACNCGSTFARFDILDRHLRTFNPQKFYPCLFCSKYSGQGAFKRLDHLTQHLRGYHNHEISAKSSDHPHLLLAQFRCPHEDCFYHQDGFGAQKDFTKHLREMHDESLYPCDVSGCSRIGGRGFSRKRDLTKHQKGHVHED